VANDSPSGSSELSTFFSEFCESATHLDSLLSKLNPNVKSKVAVLFGAFLRRPISLARHFKIDLGVTPAEFWELSFIKLKKLPGIHETLNQMWRHAKAYDDFPNQGTVDDFPPSLIAEWTQDWGDESAHAFAKFLSQDPLTTIRLRRDGIKKEAEIKTALAALGLPKMRPGFYSPVARIFKGFARVQQNEFFKAGDYEIQDEGSQVMSLYALQPNLLAPMLGQSPRISRPVVGSSGDPHSVRVPPMSVVDACAGAGGKSLAIADFLQGQGRVFSYDIYQKKIMSLKRRAERAQERNIQASVIEDVKELEKFHGTVDRVLVDAPCTGLGVLRRNPDIKWNRKPLNAKITENNVAIEELQRSIVQTYAPLVKTGGRLTFGVCTFARTETVDQAQWIAENLEGFKLESQGFVGPHETDGFFMASFLKM
jgi:16S rRNA (cytosine967-C5)-methyltransferase